MLYEQDKSNPQRDRNGHSGDVRDSGCDSCHTFSAPTVSCGVHQGEVSGRYQGLTYSGCEMTGRDILAEAISGNVEGLRFTNAPYATVDGFLTGRTGQKVVFEIKHRQFRSDRYFTVMLELAKAQSLLISKDSNAQDRAIYVCIYDDEIQMYEITEETLKRPAVTMRCPVHSAEFDGSTRLKQIIMLDPKEAIWIHRRPSRTS